VLDAAGPGPGHIFNLGHGILPQTPPENIAALVACVHAYSRAQRAQTGGVR
jgi:uroporphyrinogen decarboxylase